MDYKKTLIDLKARHSAQVKAAETAKENGSADEFSKALKEAQELHDQIEATKALIVEQELAAAEEKELGTEGEPEKQSKAAERGSVLQQKGTVKYSAEELRAGLKSTTLASGTIAKPTAVPNKIDSTPILNELIKHAVKIGFIGAPL